MNFNLADGIAVLERTPQVLRSMLQGLDSQWTETNEGPGTWSPYDNVGHLIHGEKTDWVPRARLILQQGENRVFTKFDRFAMFEESKGKSLDDLLDEFEHLRKGNLRILSDWKIDNDQLALEGQHPELGKVSLRQLLATWVGHDLGHIAQIARVMAKQYRDAVGPWRAYLPVMDRG